MTHSGSSSQNHVPQIPEFAVAYNNCLGLWIAEHKPTGRKVTARTPDRLQVLATAVRIGTTIRATATRDQT